MGTPEGPVHDTKRFDTDDDYRTSDGFVDPMIRSFGIVMRCIGIINPVFLIFGLIFLAKSNEMYRSLEEELPDQHETMEEPPYGKPLPKFLI